MPQPLSNCGSNSVVCRRTTETPELEARVASLEGGGASADYERHRYAHDRNPDPN